ncbi:MAG TPA: transglutaminase domain-containing protein [Aquabacterium sp.]|nr:transglutaminase domain-containing protein [Aquabacterium sp.]
MKLHLGSPRAIGMVVALLAMLTATLLPYARSGTELVRLRNALLFETGEPASFEWTPAKLPADFPVDGQVPELPFGPVVAALPQAGDDWSRALEMARHLVRHAKFGNPAKSDLHGTYRTILAGGGYCADYSRVMVAMAGSAGLFAREWAFSFDGYGGHGHAFVEVFDRASGQWRMIDAFNNFYPVDTASGQPLSALQWRERLRAGQTDGVRIMPIGPGRPGFRTDAQLFDYYRRGADQWYLWWGNAAYTYDASPATRLLGGVSRALEQLAAIGLGVHPRIQAIPSETNAQMREAMVRLKGQLVATGVAGGALSILLCFQLFSLWRRRRADWPHGVRHA